MVPLAAIGALRRIMGELSPHDRLDSNKLRALRHGSKRFGRPTPFVRYRDPDDRFEFSYPAEWKLQGDQGIQVTSPVLGCFARVDVMGEGRDVWMRFARALGKAGAGLSVGRRESGSPESARGGLEIGELRFVWEGHAYHVGPRYLVLSLAKVIEPPRSPLAIRYQHHLLAAIRRHFRLGRGA